MAWMQSLQLAQLDANSATLRPVPGGRDVAGFASHPKQLDTLSKRLSEVLGKSIKASVEINQQPNALQGNANHQNGQADSNPNQRENNQKRRQEALQLPLVKTVLDVFPDASLLDVTTDPQAQTKSTDEQDAS